MPGIEWRDSLSIDGGLIDQDHRHLIQIVNTFGEMSEHFASLDDALELLYALRFYARVHFQREEELQRLAAFPYLPAHHREHQDLAHRLEAVLASTRNAGPEDIGEISQATAQLLRTWIVDHLIRSDLLMKPYALALKSHEKDFAPLKEISFV